MIEAAQTEDSDSQQVKYRESLFIHKFWYKLLNKRLDDERQKSSEIE
jgi:hypothetical protein